jgi:hypothetical protein
MRRILTIDGGGIKGVFPAAFLAAIEDEIGRPIGKYFDLIAGTSTGGIIALGLGLGLTANELLRLYRETGGRIFPRRRGITSRISSVARAKYSDAPLRDVLTSAFGSRRLGEATQRLVIPSLDLAAERVHVYRTSHHPDFVRDYKLKVVEVALATVAAPTYFPVHVSSEGLPYLDGSLWARNPMALAIIEAIGVLEWPRREIKVLSIGCTSAHLDAGWKKRISLGAAYWGARIADVFMKAQSSSAIATSHALIGSESVFRISPDTSGFRFTLDGVQHIPRLEALGREEAQRQFPGLKDVFFGRHAEPFVPCHKLEQVAVPTRISAVREVLPAA